MSDSDGPKEARVEILRAEVRVLMVDSRQVTLSMARQLDAVEPREINRSAGSGLMRTPPAT
jgi:hypothetical protein